jgi:hypothetical protein
MLASLSSGGGAQRQILLNIQAARPVAAERLASGAETVRRRQMLLGGLSRSDQINEKAVRQQDGLLFQGRIVPTDFEKGHQNFLAKSYGPVKGSVKEFFENRYLCFQ